MNDLHRVFYHELGHFVAHEINRLHYHGSGTKSIIIYPTSQNPDLYVGDAKINLSADEKERDSPSSEILPEYLVSSSYGCVFQAYYTKTAFDDCFKVNGQKDEEQWYWALRNNKLDDYKSEITANEREFFNKLVEEKLLDKFMTLDPDKYLAKIDSTNYAVNIDLLRQDTKEMIKEHAPVYARLVEKNKMFVEKHKQ